jgi:hypothetical protein
MSSMNTHKLSLTEAIKTQQLQRFINQEEARGIGPANRREVETAIRHLATTPTQSGNQTSRPTSRGGSRGK